MKMAKRGLACAGLAIAVLLSGGAAMAQGTQPAPSAEPAQPSEKLYRNEQLDQMLAPVALYPDSLLSQLLMASTYPSDVAEAAAWSAKHKDAKGDDAVNQVENEQWDPSVKSLVAFPQMLDQLAKQPDWVQKTGDAFLAQPEDVMASIQRLRSQAQKAGTLKSNEQQKVIVKEVPVETSAQPASTSTTNTTVIQIEPSNPETVYVPAYNPTTAYGTWAYPSYPPPYWPPSPYYYPGYYPGAALASGIMFGVGVAAVGSLWGGFGWGHGDVDINVNKYNNINRNNQISGSGNRGSGNQKWSHNAQNRRGTPYADNRSRQQYGQGVGGANNRSSYRGNDASRQRAQQSFNKSTGYAGGNRGGTGAGANRGSTGGAGAANRGSAGAANRGSASASAANRGSASSRSAGASAGTRSSGASASRSNAFSGASSPQSAQRQSSRGQSSQRSMSSGGGRSSGGQVSRSAPSRGGGGGGRRR